MFAYVFSSSFYSNIPININEIYLHLMVFYLPAPQLLKPWPEDTAEPSSNMPLVCMVTKLVVFALPFTFLHNIGVPGTSYY